MYGGDPTLTMSPSTYSQFSRLKALGNFNTDQELLQAAFNALDQQWRSAHPIERYMKHPGLALDDYDT